MMAVRRAGIFEMADARIGDGGLAVEHQADRLHRFDGERLMGFDERAMMREIVHANRVPGVEGSPERSENFESHSTPAIARCTHHKRGPSIFALRLCKRIATVL